MIGVFIATHSILWMATASPSAGADPLQDTRARLEKDRQELSITVRDRRAMSDQGRATLTRMSIERGWKECAGNEATALAKASQKPAKLLAEQAIGACAGWEDLHRLALKNGADPYLNGHVSQDDMVELAKLDSREAALTRVLMWRGSGPRSTQAAGPGAPRLLEPDRLASLPPLRGPDALPAPSPPAADPDEPPAVEGETVITVTASRRGGCRVRLADRTLTDRELKANAAIWAASGTPLKVIRPAGADYGCMAKIAFRLGEHGVRLFHFADPGTARVDRQ